MTHIPADVVIRLLLPSDAELLSNSFSQQGWHKPVEQFRAYYRQQVEHQRQVFVAVIDDNPIGYICLLPRAPAGPFHSLDVPCLSDFNVLMDYQRQGIGSMLMDAAEQAALQTGARSICLGVGLHPGYGAAQRMYVKRGYVPDGSGVWYRDERLPISAPCLNDDDLVLYMEKLLSADCSDEK